jgi:hypothetical protein
MVWSLPAGSVPMQVDRGGLRRGDVMAEQHVTAEVPAVDEQSRAPTKDRRGESHGRDSAIKPQGGGVDHATAGEVFGRF